MVKVAKKTWIGSVVCKNCEAVLEFRKSDVEEKKMRAGAVIVEISHIIKCKNCSGAVNVSNIVLDR